MKEKFDSDNDKENNSNVNNSMEKNIISNKRIKTLKGDDTIRKINLSFLGQLKGKNNIKRFNENIENKIASRNLEKIDSIKTNQQITLSNVHRDNNIDYQKNSNNNSDNMNITYNITTNNYCNCNCGNYNSLINNIKSYIWKYTLLGVFVFFIIFGIVVLKFMKLDNLPLKSLSYNSEMKMMIPYISFKNVLVKYFFKFVSIQIIYLFFSIPSFLFTNFCRLRKLINYILSIPFF